MDGIKVKSNSRETSGRKSKAEWKGYSNASGTPTSPFVYFASSMTSSTACPTSILRDGPDVGCCVEMLFDDRVSEIVIYIEERTPS